MLIILILSTLIITASTAIFLALNPLSIGIIILSIALLLAILYSSIISSWIGFLIFLIYIGGILVIFAYFVALTPNQQINIFIIIPLSLALISIPIIIYVYSITPPSSPFSKNINTFYTLNNTSILLILAIILLFTIIVVVKIVTNNKGPLRPFYH